MKNSAASKRRVAPIRYRPTLELLEERRVPAVSLVSDNGAAAGSGAKTVLTADFNNDGRPDVIVANQGTDFTKGAGTLSIFFDRAPTSGDSSQFQPASTITVSTTSAVIAAAVGDLNGDGRPDILAATADGHLYAFYNQIGSGSTTASFYKSTVASGGNFTSLAIADLNKDGAADIVATNVNADPTKSEIDVFQHVLGTSSSFTKHAFAEPGRPTSVVVADVDRNGVPDVIVANDQTQGSVDLFLNFIVGRDVGLWMMRATPVGSNPFQIAVGDFNADGYPDVAAVNADGVTVLLNISYAVRMKALPAQEFSAQPVLDAGGTPRSLAVADLNGDGRPDLIVGLSYTLSTTDPNTKYRVSVLVNATTYHAEATSFEPFQYAAQIPVTGLPPSDETDGVAVADFNGDGRLDVAASASGGGDLFTLSNTTENSILTYPVTVINLPGYGVQLFNRTTGGWVSLNTSDASLLVVDPSGAIIGEFPKYGVFEYRPTTGWMLLSSSSGPFGDASQLAVDGYGDVFAVFPGHGINLHRPSDAANVWTQFGFAFDATALAVDYYGDVVANNPGYGVHERAFTDGWAWTRLANSEAYLLAMDANGDIFGDFRGYGVEYKRPYFNAFIRLISSSDYRQNAKTPDATFLAVDSSGANVVADFSGMGVQVYQMGTYDRVLNRWYAGWSQDVSSLAVDGYGNITFDVPGYGVNETNPNRGTSWRQLLNQEVSLLAVSGAYHP